MASQVTADGLQTDSLATIVTNMTEGFQTIYGPSVDFSSNTPDGQAINIFAQAVIDELDLSTQIYTGFDFTQAIGTTLDMRVALIGVQRRAGSASTIDIQVTSSQACSLGGTDGTVTPLFIVADAAGNQWELVNSYSFTGSFPQTQTLGFQAVNIGAVQAAANTITVPVTIVVGVTTVNNSAGPISVGTTEESDSALKLRAQASTALPSVGIVDGLQASLANIPGVVTVAVYENDTNTTGTVYNADQVANSIWVVIDYEAPATASQVAQAIYAKRSAGCVMYNNSDTISGYATRPNGSLFAVYWDPITSEALYTTFTIQSIVADLAPTGNVHSGTKVIDNLSSTSGLTVGMLVRDTTNSGAITAGTVITSIDSATQIHVSNNGLASHNGDTLDIVPFNIAALQVSLAAALVATPGESINIGQIITLMQAINPQALITSVGVSDTNYGYTTGSYVNIIAPTDYSHQFSLANTAVFIQ